MSIACILYLLLIVCYSLIIHAVYACRFWCISIAIPMSQPAGQHAEVAQRAHGAFRGSTGLLRLGEIRKKRGPREGVPGAGR